MPLNDYGYSVTLVLNYNVIPESTVWYVLFNVDSKKLSIFSINLILLSSVKKCQNNGVELF